MIVKKGITFLYGLYLRLCQALTRLWKWLEVSLGQGARPEYRLARV